MTGVLPSLSAPVARFMDRRVDGSSVAAFRALFGLLGLIAVVRFFAHGWIQPLYIEPDHHFAYLGFGWLEPWPGWGMYAHFVALGLLSVGIAAGYRTRLCAALFFVGFTYVELLDRTTYLNHYYLMSLVALLLAVLPVHRGSVPLWTIWTLRAQVGVVYIFAGVAKLNPDWLFHALPMRIWLYQNGHLPMVGAMLQETWVAYAMSWGGALFDLAIVPTLVWRRTRAFAYVLLVAFHLATWILFPQLGIFPWLMIGLSLIFFDPHWPRVLLQRMRLPTLRPGNATQSSPSRPRLTLVIVLALALFAVVQLALPLRHFAYPGNVRWNEAGYLFAWRVMLTEKVGFVQYRVREPGSGQSWLVQPEEYLTPLQLERMAFQPDLILQTAHIIADDFMNRGYPDVEVAADAFVSFNGRPNARIVDPDVNLVMMRPGLGPKQWVLPYATDDLAVVPPPAKLRPPWPCLLPQVGIRSVHQSETQISVPDYQ